MNSKLTRKRALQLLEEYSVPLSCVRHCLKVEKTALKIADYLIKHGVKIDKEFLSSAVLLHDIGRYKIAVEKGTPKEMGGLHAPEGQILLERLGYHEVAKIAGGHFLVDVNKREASALEWPTATKLPDSLEAKIISIADKLRGGETAEEEVMAILNRNDMETRYWSKASHLKEKVIKRSVMIIKELRSLGWNGRV